MLSIRAKAAGQKASAEKTFKLEYSFGEVLIIASRVSDPTLIEYRKVRSFNII